MDIDAEAHQLAPAENAAGEAFFVICVGFQSTQGEPLVRPVHPHMREHEARHADPLVR